MGFISILAGIGIGGVAKFAFGATAYGLIEASVEKASKDFIVGGSKEFIGSLLALPKTADELDKDLQNGLKRAMQAAISDISREHVELNRKPLEGELPSAYMKRCKPQEEHHAHLWEFTEKIIAKIENEYPFGLSIDNEWIVNTIQQENQSVRICDALQNSEAGSENLDQAFVEKMSRDFGDRTIAYFVEFLRDGKEKNSRVWKAYQFMVINSIQKELCNATKNQKITHDKVDLIHKKLDELCLDQQGNGAALFNQIETSILSIQTRIGMLYFDVKSVLKNTEDLKLGQQGLKEEIAKSTKKIIGTIEGNRETKSKTLGQPVPNPKILVGRENDLKDLQAQLKKGQDFLLLVNGQGGIGKTSVAQRYYCDHHDKYKHRIWLPVESGIQGALLNLGQELKIDFGNAATEEEQMPILLHALQQLDERVLLVLDNANDEEDLKENERTLRVLSPWDIVLTSRLKNYSGAKSLELEALGKDFALEMFKEYYTAYAGDEDELLLHVFEAVDRNTLVIELLAKNLATQNTRLEKRYKVKELLYDVQSKGLLKLSKTGEVSVDYKDLGSVKPEEVILAMYNLAELSEVEHVVLSCFAVLPLEYIPYRYLKELLPIEEDLDHRLEGLSEKGWLDFGEIGSEKGFRMNLIIRDIIYDKGDLLAERCEQLVSRLLIFLDYVPTTGTILGSKANEISAWVRFSESVIGRLGSSSGLIGSLCGHVQSYHLNYGLLEKAEQYSNKSKDIFLELLMYGPIDINWLWGLTISFSQIAKIQLMKCRYSDYLDSSQLIRRHVEKLVELFGSHRKFQRMLCDCYLNESYALNKLGFTDKAKEALVLCEDFIEEYLEFDASSENWLRQLAICYSKLGSQFESEPNYTEANIYFRRELKIHEKLSLEDEKYFDSNIDISICLGKLARNALNLNDLPASFEYSLKCIEILKNSLVEDPENIQIKIRLGKSYSELSKAFFVDGSIDSYIEYSRKELAVFEDVVLSDADNFSFKHSLAISCFSLGKTFLNGDKADEGVVLLERALQLRREVFSADRDVDEYIIALMGSYLEKGDRAMRDRDHLAAASCYLESIDLSERHIFLTNHSIANERELARLHDNCGEALYEFSDFKSAVHHFDIAQLLFQKLYDAVPTEEFVKRGLIESYCQSGVAYLELSDFKKSLNFFKSGLKCIELVESKSGREDEFLDEKILYLEKVALCNFKLGYNESGLSTLEESISLRRTQCLNSPEDLSFSAELAITCLEAEKLTKEIDSVLSQKYRKEALSIIKEVEDSLTNLRGKLLQNPDDSVLVQQLIFRYRFLEQVLADEDASRSTNYQQESMLFIARGLEIESAKNNIDVKVNFVNGEFQVQLNKDRSQQL